MKYLTNGDQWKGGHAVIKTPVFDSLYIPIPPSTTVESVTGLHLTVQVKCVLLGKGRYLLVHHLMSYSRLLTYLLCYAILFGSALFL